MSMTIPSLIKLPRERWRYSLSHVFISYKYGDQVDRLMLMVVVVAYNRQ